MEEVTGLPTKKGKASRRFYPKVLRARWSTVSGLKITDREACYSMLEKFEPFEFKEKLLWEDVLESIE